jgi:hypothetical protein
MDIARPKSVADPGEAQSPSSSARRCPILTFDPQWLAITRSFQPYFSTSRVQSAFPGEAQAIEMVRRELDWVQQHIGTRKIDECQTFTRIAPGPDQEGSKFQQRTWCSLFLCPWISHLLVIAMLAKRAETRWLTFCLFCFPSSAVVRQPSNGSVLCNAGA